MAPVSQSVRSGQAVSVLRGPLPPQPQPMGTRRRAKGRQAARFVPVPGGNGLGRLLRPMWPGSGFRRKGRCRSVRPLAGFVAAAGQGPETRCRPPARKLDTSAIFAELRRDPATANRQRNPVQRSRAAKGFHTPVNDQAIGQRLQTDPRCAKWGPSDLRQTCSQHDMKCPCGPNLPSRKSAITGPFPCAPATAATLGFLQGRGKRVQSEKPICTFIALARSDARRKAVSASVRGSVWVISGFTSISPLRISSTPAANSA